MPYYTCEVCNKSFNTKNDKTMHKQMHFKTFKCEFTSAAGKPCNKYFYTPENLKEHTRVHTRIKKHICNVVTPLVCNKAFVSASALAIHMRTHTGEKPYVCNFINEDNEICGKRFATSNSIKSHTYIHTGIRPYICNISRNGKVCGKRFINSSNLSLHYKTHTENIYSKQPQRRDIPSAALGNLQPFTASHTINLAPQVPHTLPAAALRQVPQVQQVLDELFENISDITSTPSILADLQPFTASHTINSAPFAALGNLQPFTSSHTINLAPPAPAAQQVLDENISNITSTPAVLTNLPLNIVPRTNNLNIYTNTIGVHKKTNICDICGMRFYLPSVLENHKEIHSGEKKFICNNACGSIGNCVMKFKCLNSLRKHIMLTQAAPAALVKPNAAPAALVKPNAAKQPMNKFFKCNFTSEDGKICGKRFKEFRYLLSHETIHEEKKYICSVCNRGFSFYYGLFTHERVHNKIKPYRCEICNIGFTQNFYLTSHIKSKNHKLKLQLCVDAACAAL